MRSRSFSEYQYQIMDIFLNCSDLTALVWISIGWQLEESFIEQIGVCHDEKVFATIWTNFTLHGASIDYRSGLKEQKRSGNLNGDELSET